jgi:hypothetical protein
VSTAEAPLNENSALSENDALPGAPDPQERSKGFRRRILHLVEEMFGPSPNAQIQGLIAMRKGGQIVVTVASDEQLRAEYERGRADLQAEIEFAERLAAVRAKYPDFDSAWKSVRPLVPRSVWAEMADNPYGLESTYQLSKLPELCEELSKLDPDKARERFRHFVRDLVALGAIQNG